MCQASFQALEYSVVTRLFQKSPWFDKEQTQREKRRYTTNRQLSGTWLHVHILSHPPPHQPSEAGAVTIRKLGAERGGPHTSQVEALTFELMLLPTQLLPPCAPLDTGCRAVE